MKNTPRSPSGLNANAKKLWKWANTQYEFDDRELALLESACRQMVRRDVASADVEKNGLIVESRLGNRCENPAAKVERAASQSLLRHLRELALDSADTRTQVEMARGPRGLRYLG